jgi:hypothetical protein
MTIERWGSLSVADHADTPGLVANVLLYDRLVLPVYTEDPNRDEKKYWVEKGWSPDLQETRLKQLGDLAIHRPWDKFRRDLYVSRRQQLEAEQFDSKIIDDYQLTRMILAQEQVTEKPPGVNHVDVIAAYNSTAAAQHDLELTAAERNLAAQAVLLTRRLAIPDIPNLEDRLRLAIDLSRDDDFRKRRADLFEWQQRMAAKDVPPEAVVAELCALTDAYNEAVRKAHKNVYWRYAFTVAGIAISLAALPIGAAAIAAGASAGLSILRFAMFDKKPAVEPGDARPAAMFHDIEAKIDLELKPPEHP